MTLIRDEEIITYVKKDHNLFILKADIPRQIILAISKFITSRAIAIIK